MRVSVNCSVTYSFEVDVSKNVADLPCYIASCDPVYFDICKLVAEKCLNYDATINSIVNDETDEFLYADF